MAASAPGPTLKAVAPERSVLVVEACPDLQVQSARALRSDGLTVVATGSSGGALALLTAWEVNLVLVSEVLPGRSGVELVREIKRVRPNCAVLMITAQPQTLAAAALAAGAAGCISTPLSLEKLAPWFVRADLQRKEAEKRFPVRATRSRRNKPSPLQLTNSVVAAREAVAE